MSTPHDVLRLPRFAPPPNNAEKARAAEARRSALGDPA
jgi:hypothetical protein